MCTHETPKVRGEKPSSGLPVVSKNNRLFLIPGQSRAEVESPSANRRSGRVFTGQLLTPAVTAELHCLSLCVSDNTHTQAHFHLAALSFFLPGILSPQPPSSSFCPLSFLRFPFIIIIFFFSKNGCCLRYYLCYTNQINRRHSFLKR